MSTKDTIMESLTELAYAITDNFCYSCYRVVKSDYCPICYTDDFMRHLSSVGVEWGTGWIISHLLREHCTPVDGEEAFEELLDECYDEVKIGCCTFSPSQIMKELDPTAFRCGVSELLADEDRFLESDGQYYEFHDIETMLEEQAVQV